MRVQVRNWRRTSSFEAYESYYALNSCFEVRSARRGRWKDRSEVVARLERWKAKALIISTRVRVVVVRAIARTHTLALPSRASQRERERENAHARTRGRCARARHVRSHGLCS